MAGYFTVIAVYATVSTLWVSADPGWYARLVKPSFQPPDLVFGLIWPLNFLVLAIIGVLISRNAQPHTAAAALAVLTVSVFFALGWAYLFYVPHHLATAAVCLVIASILTWTLIAVAWSIRPTYALGLLVYATWMTTAAALAIGYARLN
jgi:translocator protein